MDRLILLQNFIKVAESGSFSGAADQLGQTQSKTSKLIRALEDQLGVTLFARTTRSLTLTEEAIRFLPHAKSVLSRYQEATEAVRGERAEPRGLIRFLTSDGMGRALFMPYLFRFLELYPHINVEHIMTDRKIDLVENHIDLAMRMGDLKDSSYKAKRIGLARRMTVASPAYLKARGTPQTPEDLAYHNCIRFTRLADYSGTSSAWDYKNPKTGKVSSIKVSGNYAADNSSLVRDAAVNGIGIYQGPSWLFTKDVSEGRFTQILSDYEMEPFPIFLLHPPVDYVPLRINAMIEFLTTEFSINASITG